MPQTPGQPFQRFIKVLELGYWQTAKSQGLQLTAVKGKRGQEGLFWILRRALVQVLMSGTQIFWMSEEVLYGATVSGTQLFQMIAEAQCGATMSRTQKFQMSEKVQCGANHVWDTNVSHGGWSAMWFNHIWDTNVSNECRSAVWCNNVPPYHALMRCKIITSGRLLPFVMILYINKSLDCENLVVDHILFNKQKAVIRRGFFSV